MKTGELESFLLSMKGATKDFKVEWEWWRYLVGDKMFAAVLRPGPEHKAPYAEHNLLTLKCDPAWAEALTSNYADIFPGFYMNKRNWISIDLDGDVPDELLHELCEHSYSLVFSGLTKKRQREIVSD